MATVTFKKEIIVNISDKLPAVGSAAPAFNLVKQDLSEVTLKELEGKNVILNIFPSLDTDTCAASVRKFNKEASSLTNTEVLAISADLPFAASRFCTTEGLKGVHSASVFRNANFAKDYGVLMLDGPLRGLLARAVVVVDTTGKVIYTELVSEIADEPNYAKALDALK